MAGSRGSANAAVPHRRRQGEGSLPAHGRDGEFAREALNAGAEATPWAQGPHPIEAPVRPSVERLVYEALGRGDDPKLEGLHDKGDGASAWKEVK